MNGTIKVGDCLALLREIPDNSINCVVTSPPYFGLRDYGMPGQIGLEPTPDEYISKLVEVFQEVCRVLRDDGTLWLNLGDSYTGSASTGGTGKETDYTGKRSLPNKRAEGLKPKDLIGIPWRVAFALQADGWYLRQDIIWHKPNPMPESVTDRCTKAHEYIFLLTKSAKYWFDSSAIAESSVYAGDNRGLRTDSRRGTECNSVSGKTGDTRNKRSVWSIATQPYKEAHFAVFPMDIPLLCISAGCPPGGVVLDPFCGSGTTLAAAHKLGMHGIGLELNPDYAKLAEKRISAITGNIFAEAK